MSSFGSYFFLLISIVRLLSAKFSISLLIHFSTSLFLFFVDVVQVDEQSAFFLISLFGIRNCKTRTNRFKLDNDVIFYFVSCSYVFVFICWLQLYKGFNLARSILCEDTNNFFIYLFAFIFKLICNSISNKLLDKINWAIDNQWSVLNILHFKSFHNNFAFFIVNFLFCIFKFFSIFINCNKPAFVCVFDLRNKAD